jgi:hypothetical protein
MFFTSNCSNETLFGEVQQFRSQKQLETIQIKFQTGTTIQWFDVELSQQNGVIQTKLRQPDFLKSFTLPYDSSLTMNEHFDRLIYPTLRSSVLCCSQLKDFYTHYMCLYTCCIYNRFPLHLIQQHLQRFFHRLNPSKEHLQYDQFAYNEMRQQLLHIIWPLSTSKKHKQTQEHNQSATKKIKQF